MDEFFGMVFVPLEKETIFFCLGWKVLLCCGGGSEGSFHRGVGLKAVNHSDDVDQ